MAAYGTENDNNGVIVGVAARDVQGSAARTRLLENSDRVTVEFNPGLSGDQLAVTVAHEGRHAGDALAWTATHAMGGPLDLNHYFREQRAWFVSSYIAEALNMRRYGPAGARPEFNVWNSGWTPADRETLRSHGVDNIIRGLMGLAPADTNTYSSEHPHRP